MYGLHEMDIRQEFLEQKTPVLLDTNAIIGAEGLEHRAEKFITDAVFAEAHGVSRHTGRGFDRQLKKAGTSNICLENKRQEYLATLYQDPGSFDRNLESISESMYSNEADEMLDPAAKELAHDRMTKQYISNMITKAIAENHDKLNKGKDALSNIVTDAELVYLALYSALKGSIPAVVSGDSDVPSIMNLVWNEARARSQKLCSMLEDIEEDSRDYSRISAELDMLQDIECAKVRFSSPAGYQKGNFYSSSLKEAASKIREMM